MHILFRSEGQRLSMPRFLHIACVFTLILAPLLLAAQDDVSLDPNEIPLGDLARELRGAKPPEQPGEVIDNDNIEHVMDKAESERLDGEPVFAISHTGVFTATSPDGSCSLTFDARSAHPPVAYIATDLPQGELVKLQGPATIQNGELEVSVHNGSQWELKEIVVGISVLGPQSGPPEYRFATLESVPVVASEKLPDMTTLYHLKGSALPDSTSIFRGPMDSGDVPAQKKDWHWSIVGARGIPPAAPASVPQSLAAAGKSLTAPGISSNPALGNSDSSSVPTASPPPADLTNSDQH